MLLCSLGCLLLTTINHVRRFLFEGPIWEVQKVGASYFGILI